MLVLISFGFGYAVFVSVWGLGQRWVDRERQPMTTWVDRVPEGSTVSPLPGYETGDFPTVSHVAVNVMPRRP